MIRFCCDTKSTRAGKANARREKVIQAARAAFAEHGFHAAGIAQIAQGSGVPVGQIYRDFANKEAIVAAIVTRDLDEFMSDRELCAMAQAGDPEVVKAWIADFIACGDMANRRLVAEIFAEASRNERVAEIVRTIEERVQTGLGDVLHLLVPATVPPARFAYLAELILTISGGVFRRRLIRPDQPDPEVIETLVSFIHAAIERERASAAHA